MQYIAAEKRLEHLASYIDLAGERRIRSEKLLYKRAVPLLTKWLEASVIYCYKGGDVRIGSSGAW